VNDFVAGFQVLPAGADRSLSRRLLLGMRVALRAMARWLAERREARADACIRRAGRLQAIRVDTRSWRGS
jgi:hypothetical protein